MTARAKQRRVGGERSLPARSRARSRAAAPSALDPAAFSRVAKGLAEATRFEVLALIAAEPGISCGQIVERFPLSQPAISHHLKLLQDAELVTVRREGKHGLYTLQPARVRAFASELRRRLL